MNNLYLDPKKVKVVMKIICFAEKLSEKMQ